MRRRIYLARPFERSLAQKFSDRFNEAMRAAMEKAWNDALDHVWELADPARTVNLGENQERRILTGVDVVQAQRENPYKGSPQGGGR